MLALPCTLWSTRARQVPWAAAESPSTRMKQLFAHASLTSHVKEIFKLSFHVNEIFRFTVISTQPLYPASSLPPFFSPLARLLLLSCEVSGLKPLGSGILGLKDLSPRARVGVRLESKCEVCEGECVGEGGV